MTSSFEIQYLKASVGNQEMAGIEVVEEVPILHPTDIASPALSLLFLDVFVEIMFLFQMIKYPYC